MTCSVIAQDLPGMHVPSKIWQKSGRSQIEISRPLQSLTPAEVGVTTSVSGHIPLHWSTLA